MGDNRSESADPEDARWPPQPVPPGQPDTSLAHDRGLPSRIADRLASSIIDGSFAPGARLSEPELAEMMGTSRTPVREALRMLERDSLVTLLPRKGARVSRIDAAKAADIYSCRAYLYGLAAKLATLAAHPEELAELLGFVDQMEAAVTAPDIAQYFHLNVSFHERVAAIAGNDMLLRLIAQLGRITLRLRFLSLTIDGRLDESLEWHRKLAAAMRSRDANEAEVIVRTLIRDAGEAVLREHFHDHDHADRLISIVSLAAQGDGDVR